MPLADVAPLTKGRKRMTRMRTWIVSLLAAARPPSWTTYPLSAILFSATLIFFPSLGHGLQRNAPATRGSEPFWI